MTTSTLHQALAGQTVVILGGSSGIGLETAHQARSADARVILTGRQRERLDRAARDVDAAGTGYSTSAAPPRSNASSPVWPRPSTTSWSAAAAHPMRRCATSTSTKLNASSTSISSVRCGWPARASDGFDPAVH